MDSSYQSAAFSFCSNHKREEEEERYDADVPLPEHLPRTAICGETYRLRYIIDDNSTIRIAIVHRGEGFVPLLPRGIPYFEFDRGGVVEGDGLGEEGGADGGFSVVVELVFDESEDERGLWRRWCALDFVVELEGGGAWGRG